MESLRCDQERLRQAKEEEAEQLHEVINKLQEELSQLDPNHHEVSDPNTDSPESSDFPWSPRPHQQRAPEESLRQELNTHTLQSSRARSQELQMELERSAGEREALQKLLLAQEEQYGSQVETLGRSLGEERVKVVALEREVKDLKVKLEESRAEVETLSDTVRELEEKQENLRESELRVRRAEEKREEEVQREREEKEQLERQVSTLRHKDEELQNELAAARFRLEELEEQVQTARDDVIALEEETQELCVEREALREREACLQEEMERMKQEVMSKTDYITRLHEQQEETAAEQGEAQKEVLVRFITRLCLKLRNVQGLCVF